jgi:hypothetical protein
VDAQSNLRQAWVSASLERLGAPPEICGRFAARAGTAPAVREVLVSTSPAVAEALGLSSRYVPIGAFIAALAADLAGFGVLIREIRGLARELAKTAPKAPTAQTASAASPAAN